MKLIDILDATPFPIGYRLAFVTNFWREPVLRRMERDFGIIRPELTVLICVSFRGNINARDVCEITEQPSNTVSRAVTSLERKGLITRTRDAVDTRRQLLNISTEGQKLHDRIMAMFAAAEQEMLAGLTPAEIQTLGFILDKLARDVERWRPD